MVNITIIGGGRMGSLIAIKLALTGNKISIYCLSTVLKETIKQQINNLVQLRTISNSDHDRVLKNIKCYNSDILYGIWGCNDEIILECINEDLNSKQNILETISHKCSRHTIILTNTISLPITEVASKTKDPTKVIGCRFLYPVIHINKVEISMGGLTSNDTLERLRGFLTTIGYYSIYKQPNLNSIIRLADTEARAIIQQTKLETSNKSSKSDSIESDVNEFNCPISMLKMVDPVIAMDGHTYERIYIETWFKKKSTSPMTGLSIDKHLVPNHTLRKLINKE